MKTIVTIGAPGITALLRQAIGNDYHIVDGDYPGNVRKSPAVLFHYMSIIKRAEIVYFLFVNPHSSKLARIAKWLGKKVVYHWIGTDVYQLQQNKYAVRDLHVERADLLLSYSPNLQEELAAMGVETTIYAMPPEGLSMVPGKMPHEHAVLLSIPDESKEFYGYNEMVELIEHFPQLRFYVVRSTHPEYYNYPNVVFKGMLSRQEMDELYDEISIVIRFPKHDGQSLVLMESTIKGKTMIYRFTHPFAYKAENVDEMSRYLSKIIKEEPRINIEASMYGIHQYNVETARDRGLELLSNMTVLTGKH